MFVKNVTFLDSCNGIVKSCKITSLPIKEQIIISKCIEFFNDPEPCFIHRGAVMKRLIAEMEEYFLKIAEDGKQEIKWCDFPEKYRESLGIKGEIGSIRFII